MYTKTYYTKYPKERVHSRRRGRQTHIQEDRLEHAAPPHPKTVFRAGAALNGGEE